MWPLLELQYIKYMCTELLTYMYMWSIGQPIRVKAVTPGDPTYSVSRQRACLHAGGFLVEIVTLGGFYHIFILVHSLGHVLGSLRKLIGN